MYRQHNSILRCVRGFYQIILKRDSICVVSNYLQLVNYFFSSYGSDTFLLLTS